MSENEDSFDNPTVDLSQRVAQAASYVAVLPHVLEGTLKQVEEFEAKYDRTDDDDFDTDLANLFSAHSQHLYQHGFELGISYAQAMAEASGPSPEGVQAAYRKGVAD